MTKLIFSDLDQALHSLTVLDLVADTHAWIKNTRGEFAGCNYLFCRRFGFETADELVGMSDFDLAPSTLAESYTTDDAHVLAGGTVVDRLELMLSVSGSADWFRTSKWPVHNRSGSVIGSLGMSRHLNLRDTHREPFQELQEPVDYIAANFARQISVVSLASACHLSVSALERRFRKHLNKTPRQYINEVRLNHARELVVMTNMSIGAIAVDSGFADHSHFTRAFVRHFGLTPREARRQAAPESA